MSDKYFIDTNLLVYSFDDQQPEKKERSLVLISDALQTKNGMISWQVVQEFINVSTRKFLVPLKPQDVKAYLTRVLNPLCQVFPDFEIYQAALDIEEETGYSFYDSLIISAALRGGCKFLYSEDLQNEQIIHSVRIVNPFLSEKST